MASFTDLLYVCQDGILTITINKPDKLNILSTNTLDEIKKAVLEANSDSNVKGIIFTGAGTKAFVAGADIKELSQIGVGNAKAFSKTGQKVFELIESSAKPVIAAINGFALGGGCELALACHIRIASETARFGLPEVSLGIIPAYGGTQRLTQLVGKGYAFELIMTGDVVTAQRAYEIGLVNYVVPADQLLPKSIEIMSKILQKAPIAVSSAIQSINAVNDTTVIGYEVEAEAFTICIATKDFVEGTTAFIEKRKPGFQGQ